MAGEAFTIGDTDKARNIEVRVDGAVSIEQMEAELCRAAAEIGLVLSHTTTLSLRKYPGNRHWHFKQSLKEKGCLDVTHWPAGALLWITVRNYEPAWVHTAGPKLAHSLNRTV